MRTLGMLDPFRSGPRLSAICRYPPKGGAALDPERKLDLTSSGARTGHRSFPLIASCRLARSCPIARGSHRPNNIFVQARTTRFSLADGHEFYLYPIKPLIIGIGNDDAQLSAEVGYLQIAVRQGIEPQNG